MDSLQKLQTCFQTLADANRLRIIKSMGDQALSVSEMIKSTGLSQPLVSHHLRILRDKGFLKTERKGPFIYYQLREKKLLDALGIFLDIVNSFNFEKIEENTFCCPPFWKRHHHKFMR